MRNSTNGNHEWARAVIETFVPAMVETTPDESTEQRDVISPERTESNA